MNPLPRSKSFVCLPSVQGTIRSTRSSISIDESNVSLNSLKKIWNNTELPKNPDTDLEEADPEIVNFLVDENQNKLLVDGVEYQSDDDSDYDDDDDSDYDDEDNYDISDINIYEMIQIVFLIASLFLKNVPPSQIQMSEEIFYQNEDAIRKTISTKKLLELLTEVNYEDVFWVYIAKALSKSEAVSKKMAPYIKYLPIELQLCLTHKGEKCSTPTNFTETLICFKKTIEPFFFEEAKIFPII